MTDGISTSPRCLYKSNIVDDVGDDANLLI